MEKRQSLKLRPGQLLLRAGLAPEHIDLCGLCTACRRDWFWSHRKMGQARGAQVAVIIL